MDLSCSGPKTESRGLPTLFDIIPNLLCRIEFRRVRGQKSVKVFHASLFNFFSNGVSDAHLKSKKPVLNRLRNLLIGTISGSWLKSPSWRSSRPTELSLSFIRNLSLIASPGPRPMSTGQGKLELAEISFSYKIIDPPDLSYLQFRGHPGFLVGAKGCHSPARYLASHL